MYGSVRSAHEVLRAGAVGAALSGIPSTVHALVTGADVLVGAEAAGSLLLPWARRRALLVAAAGPVHVALSFGWATVLARVLPRRRPVAEGVLAGLAIAALDLGVIGRRLPRIAALPQPPQVADHIAYGVAVSVMLYRDAAVP